MILSTFLNYYHLLYCVATYRLHLAKAKNTNTLDKTIKQYPYYPEY